MASIVSVEQIKGLAAGSTPNTITIPSGQKIVASDVGAIKAPGAILQLISVEATGNYSFNTGSTGTYVDVNALTLNITPKFNNSKIFLTAKIDVSGASGQRFALRFTRDGSVPTSSIGDADGTRTRSHTSGVGQGSNAVDNGGMGMQFLDSPATTNQVTYKVQVTMEGNNQLVINRSITHADSTSVYVALSTLTAMEVAQ
jgi:hypothetical protein